MNTKQLHRKTDPDTSKEGAKVAVVTISELQNKVLFSTFEMIKCTERYDEGVTWKDVTRWELLRDTARENYRRRFGELLTMGYIEPTGETRDRCRLFRLTEAGKAKVEELKNPG